MIHDPEYPVQGNLHTYHEIGRAMATIMSDEVFHDVAYKAKQRDHLLAGLDEFLDAVTVLPPGEWDPSIRIEPPQNVCAYLLIKNHATITFILDSFSRGQEAS